MLFLCYGTIKWFRTILSGNRIHNKAVPGRYMTCLHRDCFLFIGKTKSFILVLLGNSKNTQNRLSVLSLPFDSSIPPLRNNSNVIGTMLAEITEQWGDGQAESFLHLLVKGNGTCHLVVMLRELFYIDSIRKFPTDQKVLQQVFLCPKAAQYAHLWFKQLGRCETFCCFTVYLYVCTRF